jgi:hypothetical protein
MGRVFNTLGEKRNSYRVPVENPEGKRALGRSKLRWGDNIKMNLKRNIMRWY